MQIFYRFLKSQILILVIAAAVLISSGVSAQDTTMKFKRLWPTFRQPFNVSECTSIVIDSTGNFYIVDKASSCVHKFTPDGLFITTWGKKGSGPGEFKEPYGIAVDASDNLYIADGENYRVQKFDSNGRFITQWGSYGTGNGQFLYPVDIEIDSEGNIYVSDNLNTCVQKFTSDGTFILKWGGQGYGNGLFYYTSGLAIDSEDNVYVGDIGTDLIQKFDSSGRFLTQWGGSGNTDGLFDVPYGIDIDAFDNVIISDRQNSRIQKFTSDGAFISKWGELGAEDGQFAFPGDITVDDKGMVYITGTLYPSIHKFTLDGVFISKWGNQGSGKSQFDMPQGIVADSEGNIYVADENNNRIQKFDSQGNFILQWGTTGSGNGQLDAPYAMAIDSQDNIYVSEIRNHRIQKFTTDGTFILKWGTWGYDRGQFTYPNGIAVDSNGYVYVADPGLVKDSFFNFPRIQKFTSTGSFVKDWGVLGNQEGQMIMPEGLAVDSDNNIYVADNGFNPYDRNPVFYPRIHKFTSDGSFIKRWGSYGTGDTEFYTPKGLVFDPDDNLYVVDAGNSRISKYSTEGDFISKFGELGSIPGQFNVPFGITMGKDNQIYVTDTTHHRVQVFEPRADNSNSKAIIIAGGGAYPTNTLWDSTQMAANFAYRALCYQGYSKQSIYYLSENTGLDLDLNGQADDVDGDCTQENIEYAVSHWAQDAENLTIYLVDHGGDEVFLLSGYKILQAADLDQWIDTLQQSTGCKVNIVYDACESGSFVSKLSAPDNQQRIVVTSTSENESAYFMNQGTVSFSNYFWTNIFNGLDIKNSFDLAASAMKKTDYQTPLLDDNGNGMANESSDGLTARNTYIGSGTRLTDDAPMIGSISPSQTLSDNSSVTIWADNVTDTDNIARVWAIIRPPDFFQDPSIAVQTLPSIDLTPQVDQNGSRTGYYSSSYNQFSTDGTYRVTIYAKDEAGNTSIPQTLNITVGDQQKTRAVIVIGAEKSDPIYSNIKNSAKLCYEALTFQGFTNDDIYFMGPETYFSGVDALAAKSTVQSAIETWAGENADNVIVYFIGTGKDESFQVNDHETISSTELNTWFTTLEGKLSGNLYFIYDACQSGSFISSESGTSKRVIITSTRENESALFSGKGDISFSRYFWNQISGGANIMNAFITSSQAVGIFSDSQTPLMEANGNGTPNENDDLSSTRSTTFGSGIILADDEIAIGSVSDHQTLVSTTRAVIQAEEITSLNPVSKVWAIITPPDISDSDPDNPIVDLPVLNLDLKNDKYQGTWYLFEDAGTYDIAVYAMDDEGNISFPVSTSVTQTQEKCKTDIFSAAISKDQAPDTPVAITINSDNDCSRTPSYRFSFHPHYGTADYDGLQWTQMTGEEYTTQNFVNYTFEQSGKSIVVVWATDDPENEHGVGVPIVGWSVDTQNQDCRTIITGAGMTGTKQVNHPVLFTVDADNTCTENLYYRFSMHPDYGTNWYDGTQWTSMTDSEWITDNTLDFTFTKAGRYVVVVWVSDTDQITDPTGIPIIGWSVDIE